MMLHEQAAPAAVTSWSSTCAPQHFPTSVLLQEQRDEYKPYNKEVRFFYFFFMELHSRACLNAYNESF